MEARPQLLVMIKGHPGCGKSTLSELLCQQLQRCALIDKDDCRDCFQPHVNAAPCVDWNALSYDVMFSYAARQLLVGLHVVVDCPLAHVHLYQRAKMLAEQHNCVLVVVEVEVSDESSWRRRLEARAAADAGSHRVHKPQTWEEIQAMLKRYDGCWRWSRDGSLALTHHLLLDLTNLSSHGAVSQVLEFFVERKLLAPVCAQQLLLDSAEVAGQG